MRYMYTGSKPFIIEGKRIFKGDIVDWKVNEMFVPIPEMKKKKTKKITEVI